MSGTIARLFQPTGSGTNSSYALSFWGTTLHCETRNRTLEKMFNASDVTLASDTGFGIENTWLLPNFTSSCRLMTDVQSLQVSGITNIIYRTFNNSGVVRYYPCLDNADQIPADKQELGIIDIPDPGITVLIPVTETVCHPELRRYSINVTSDAFGQHVSSSYDDDEYIPVYASDFKSFNGSYELWVHFSDALSIYNEFAANLNRSYVTEDIVAFDYDVLSNRMTAHTLDNDTIVETCTLSPRGSFPLGIGSPEIWPLSVFERRLSINEMDHSCARFDEKMANELLINTTISALALNKRFRVVNGTETRAFNVYRFKNKLAFFIPYGLSIGLGIPIIALGLLSFYIHNQGTSAISGGFLQLLMTTTGRTDLDDMVFKHSATMGGYENVSDELKAVEVRFGELIKVGADEQDGKLATSTCSSEQVSDVNIARHDEDDQDNGAEAASVVDTLENNEPGSGRFGFGLAHEVRPLRRRNVG